MVSTGSNRWLVECSLTLSILFKFNYTKVIFGKFTSRQGFWDLGMGIGIGHWDWEFGLGNGIGDWDLGLRLGIRIRDWDWGLRIGD